MLFLVFLNLLQPGLAVLNFDLIKLYAEHRFIKYTNIYSCDNNRFKTALLLKGINHTPIQIYNINSPNVIESSLQYFKSRMLMVVDGDCPAVEILFEQANQQKINIFNDKLRWLILTNSDLVLRQIVKLRLNINSDVKLAVRFENYWNLSDIYNPSKDRGAEMVIDIYGKYFVNSNSFLLSIDRRKHLYERRSNLQGMRFNSKVVITDAYEEETLDEHLRSDYHPEKNSFNRVMALYNYYCAELFNASVDITATNSWGYRLPNGSFDGIVGSLISGLEFGSSPIFIIEERKPYVDYGVMMWKLKSAFLFRHPKSIASTTVFLTPFQKKVWFTLLGLMTLMVFSLKLLAVTEINVLSRSVKHSEWSTLVMILFGALCQQGSPHLSTFIPSRIIIFFLFFVTVLLYQFYSASLVSTLLLQPKQTINTIRDLAYSDLKVGCEDLLLNHQYMAKLFENKEMLRLLQKQYNGLAFYMTKEEGMPLVAKGNFAFHMELVPAYEIIRKTFSEDAICDLEEVPFFSARPIMTNYRKHSPFRDMFNYCMQKLNERGIMFRQYHHYFRPRPSCIKIRNLISAVGIEEFYSALIIIVIGVLLSALLLCAEILHFRWKLSKMHFIYIN